MCDFRKVMTNSSTGLKKLNPFDLKPAPVPGSVDAALLSISNAESYHVAGLRALAFYQQFEVETPRFI